MQLKQSRARRGCLNRGLAIPMGGIRRVSAGFGAAQRRRRPAWPLHEGAGVRRFPKPEREIPTATTGSGASRSGGAQGWAWGLLALASARARARAHVAKGLACEVGGAGAGISIAPQGFGPSTERVSVGWLGAIAALPNAIATHILSQNNTLLDKY